MSEKPAGYNVKLHQALTERIMIAGVPRTFFIMNLVAGFSITVQMRQPWIGIPVPLFLHFAAYQIHQIDPYFLEIAKKYMKLKHFLDV